MKTPEMKETHELKDTPETKGIPCRADEGTDDCPEWGQEALAEIIRFAAQKPRRKVAEVIMHCSATPAGRRVRLEDIRRWHVEERGWRDVGYHFVVELDGRIRRGRPMRLAGAHCPGHNTASVGICYVGGLDADMHPCDTRTPSQRRALSWLVALLRRYLGSLPVRGHRDFAGKACPCFDAASEYA